MTDQPSTQAQELADRLEGLLNASGLSDNLEYDGTLTIFDGRAHVAYISNDQSGERGRAVARFYAAAPRLLRALKGHVERLQKSRDTIQEQAQTAYRLFKEQFDAAEALAAEQAARIERLRTVNDERLRVIGELYDEQDKAGAQTAAVERERDTLRAAIRGLANFTRMDDGSLCWCGVAVGMGDCHAAYCDEARAALAGATPQAPMILCRQCDFSTPDADRYERHKASHKPAQGGETLRQQLDRDAIEQASRLLREWAGERQRAQGKWTMREQAGVDCAIKLDALLAASPEAPPRFDFASHLQRQREFSERTFGPGTRTAGVVDHIRKELREVEAHPTDLSEWIDVTILALDGAWRAGYSPEQIIAALVAKQTKNEGRNWPDWRTQSLDKAIEHNRAEGLCTACSTEYCEEHAPAAEAPPAPAPSPSALDEALKADDRCLGCGKPMAPSPSAGKEREK